MSRPPGAPRRCSPSVLAVVRGGAPAAVLAAVLAGVLAGTLAGCAAMQPQQDPCLLGDTMGFSSPEQLATWTATVVRGRVTGVAEARGARDGFVAEPVTLTVDEVVRARDGGPAGPTTTVDLFVVDPSCPGGREEPTRGYAGDPVVSEVPAVGTEVVVFFGAAGDDAASAATVWGYARVDGDRATFAGTAGSLRGQSFDVAELERIARRAPATPPPG